MGDSSAISDHVDDPGAGEDSGQEASLGHEEWFLVTDDVSRVSMTSNNLQYEGSDSLNNNDTE